MKKRDMPADDATALAVELALRLHQDDCTCVPPDYAPEWKRPDKANCRTCLTREIAAALSRRTPPARAEIDAVAHWMLSRSYATGHGDTVDDLLSELEAQAMQRADFAKKGSAL